MEQLWEPRAFQKFESVSYLKNMTMQWSWKQCSIQRSSQMWTCWNFRLSMRTLFFWQFVKVYSHNISGVFESSWMSLRRKLKTWKNLRKRQENKIKLLLSLPEIVLWKRVWTEMFLLLEHLGRLTSNRHLCISSSVFDHGESTVFHGNTCHPNNV